MVLAIFDDVKRNGGHTIDIKSIIENSDNIMVILEFPNSDGDLTTVITQPFLNNKNPRYIKNRII